MNILCLKHFLYKYCVFFFIIFKWNIELLQIFIFELVQYTFYQYFYLACKYKDYFPLKLIGKYLLLYNNYLLLRDDFRIGLVISPRVGVLA
jgi:hypothetical protein